MFKDSFCSSPWMHLRITHTGDFQECRWIKKPSTATNFADKSIIEFYNGEQMKDLRLQLLDGGKPSACSECYYQDQYGKFSGRQRQLLKSAIRTDQFDITTRSSPHYEMFEYSYNNSGESNYYPVDFQIDLGNTCNSACVMCTPFSSSLLTQDYKKLHKINSNMFAEPRAIKSWTRDPLLVQKFVNEIVAIPNLKYIHFLGGETLYDPAFYIICEKLIEIGKAKDIIVGTTTNGTIYDQRLENLIKGFKEFNLGVSIESVTDLNDYIRYPSKVDEIIDNTKKFLELRNSSQLQVSLRITPNLFTIYDLDRLFEFMIENHVMTESCNLLTDPAVLRMELLPDDIRQECIDKFDSLISRYNLEQSYSPNIRNNIIIDKVIANTAIEYRDFLKNYKQLDNVELLRLNLISFLKGFESLRGNSILDYAPRYTDFLRSQGY
jgi:MoaA/NifB/PqqE/SkfB family radical SAM enzyme